MEVRAGIHQARLPLPFWSRDVNVYLIEDDDGYVLVDCGVNTEEAVLALESYLQEVGCTFSNVTKIWITHCHHDHYGMMATIKEQSQASIGMHSLQAEQAERLYGRAGTLRSPRYSCDTVFHAWRQPKRKRLLGYGETSFRTLRLTRSCLTAKRWP